jgi:hypothetical protein
MPRCGFRWSLWDRFYRFGAGGVIAFPTDTACGWRDPFNDCCSSNLEIRTTDNKPIPLLVNPIAMAQSVAHVSDRALALAERFWLTSDNDPSGTRNSPGVRDCRYRNDWCVGRVRQSRTAC